MAYVKYNQKGASHLLAVLLIVVVALVGVVGYKVSQAGKSVETADNASQSAPVVVTPKKATANSDIKTTADLKQASQSLNSTSVDSDLNPDALNDDVNSLL